MSRKLRTPEEYERELLRHLKRGRTVQTLSEFLDSPGAYIEERLVDLRRRGLVLCTNKLWYRKDIALRPPEPRPPILSEADLKFLAKQTGFGFGENRG